MSIRIASPDANYAGSGLPKFEKRIAGFPVSGLHALYLFEDGTVGDDYVTALDRSGNDNHASLFNGSVNPVVDAYGLVSNANNAFAFSVPGRTFGLAYSGVLVGRTEGAAGTAGARPAWWRPSLHINGGSVANNQSLGEFLNTDMTNATDTPGLAMRGIYSQAANDASPVQTMPTILVPGASKNNWIAVAWSFNPVTDTYTLVSGGVTNTKVSAAAAAAAEALGGLHTFGVHRYSTALKGHLALAGLYNKALSATDLQAVCKAARIRAQARMPGGVTVY